MLESSPLRMILAAGNRYFPNYYFFLFSMAVAIAKSLDSYLAMSIARFIKDRRVLVRGELLDKGFLIESIAYERT